MARVVLNTFGSLGDLNPYLATALALQRRGHRPLIATSAVYREKVEAEGIEFAPVRPDVGKLLGDTEFLKKLWHPRLGTEYLVRKYILPELEASYEDLLRVCDGADLLLTHSAGYAGPIAAESRGVPWVSVALQPVVFFSRYDPPVLPPAIWLRHTYRFGALAFRLMMALGKGRLDRWAAPIAQLRKRVGLPRAKANPMLEGQFSPLGTLALFSPHFAAPQPDWPPNTRATGFIFYDRQGDVPGAVSEPENAEADLARFLERGTAPILFTLGSSAVMHPGNFFRESIAAAKMLGKRAVLLVGRLEKEQWRSSLPDSIYVASYLPFSEIMPKAAAIVHQGGIGTTAQALRAGRPMLVVPWSHDQPDNAERLRRLGVVRIISRSRYTAARAARALDRLLNDPGYEKRASDLSTKIGNEDGITAACDALEEMLKRR